MRGVARRMKVAAITRVGDDMDPKEYASKTFPCPGEAHNPAVGGMIDHCGICAPDWGKIPAHRSITPEARFVLLALDALGDDPLVRMPPHDAFAELESKGLAESVRVTEETRSSLTSFYVPRLTDFGRAAVAAMRAARKGKRIKRTVVGG